MSLFRPLRLYGVLLASLGVVIAVALFTPVADDALTRTAYGWIAGVAVFIAATLARMARAQDADAIRRRAAALDQTGAAVLPLSLLAAAASVVVVVGEARSHGSPLTGGLLALGTVALSWTFIHLMFALHYAHAFYQRDHEGGDRGGLMFPGETQPDYWDFLHFALIIGVACQTADVQISDRGVRRLSSVHSLTAFVFNTVIVALAVNLAVGALGAG
ncbi:MULTISPECIES: DUF1345 domain-containing protein [Brevundimonas]|jgi:uncharacterized membrane protein|uniref:Putative membrane protein n=1 Tax=Brevundimonas aurantiaca TaxID=74316 RepID=A0A7W9FBG2_9CAUL|nr:MULTISPECIES: DUF1345 domain-containing protein [Brevundimonas]MBB1178065.1 DUF1345 domain-containing protein [Pseudomonas sp. FW305-3-2-15-E-TSA4]MAL57973.1 hypothetical protein [Brevundimonas sp.]MBB5741403.1 putative membrane protein [Brevundimonas aurantiaca]MBJ7511317.1 DUF1345 domain-containing protein [Brevundimonas sp.]MCC4294299.1 DUF1345 domain-containing protein [Brevundimonas aurantiaca]